MVVGGVCQLQHLLPTTDLGDTPTWALQAPLSEIEGVRQQTNAVSSRGTGSKQGNVVTRVVRPRLVPNELAGDDAASVWIVAVTRSRRATARKRIRARGYGEGWSKVHEQPAHYIFSNLGLPVHRTTGSESLL